VVLAWRRADAWRPRFQREDKAWATHSTTVVRRGQVAVANACPGRTGPNTHHVGALGLAKLPFRSFQMNEAWMRLALGAQDLLASAKELTLTGDLGKAKPGTLPYRLLHQAGRLVRSGRRTRLRLAPHWPWADALTAACARSTPCPCPRGEPAIPPAERAMPPRRLTLRSRDPGSVPAPNPPGRG
jgi:hypothetical protein